jgi:hypothetical protein
MATNEYLQKNLSNNLEFKISCINSNEILVIILRKIPLDTEDQK